MKIDRHNYEEYFLLYIDNELTVDQKKQVELFVQENADLGEELAMLEQSKLIPDQSIHFNKKETLMKDESNSFITMSNYGEWLVLHVDNELSEGQRIAVEKFAATHPHVQQELVLFQQTTLEPEKIVFPNKETLYRHEKVRVITMQWWRVAVAAILIIAAGISLYSILNNRKKTNDLASGRIINTKITQPAQNTVRSIAPNTTEKTSPVIKGDQEQIVTHVPIKKAVKENSSKQDQHSNPNTSDIADNNRPRTVTPISETQAQQSQMTSTLLASNQIRKEIFKDTTVTKPTLKSPDLYNTPEIDRSVAGGENKKLRGFFRKTTRILVRSTAESDNKLLIGGVAINVR